MDLDKDVLRIVTSMGQEEKHYSIYKNWFEFCF